MPWTSGNPEDSIGVRSQARLPADVDDVGAAVAVTAVRVDEDGTAVVAADRSDVVPEHDADTTAAPMTTALQARRIST